MQPKATMYPMMTSMGVDSVRGVPMEKSELAWKCALVLTLGRGGVAAIDEPMACQAIDRRHQYLRALRCRCKRAAARQKPKKASKSVPV
jgi:hypothetical protein